MSMGQSEKLREAAYIVDDDATIRDSLALLLSTADVSARAFPTAEDFLANVDLGEPACLLLDLRLPGMHGLELLKRLSASASNISVIVITGHGDVPMAVAAMRSGAFHFIEKPFDPEALLGIVDEALQRLDKMADVHAQIQQSRDRHGQLTPREQEVLELLVDGLPTKLIAHELGISTRTAEHHRSAVMKKMGARTLSHLVRMTLNVKQHGSSLGS
jgi:two-component system response regulator FixJ